MPMSTQQLLDLLRSRGNTARGPGTPGTPPIRPQSVPQQVPQRGTQQDNLGNDLGQLAGKALRANQGPSNAAIDAQAIQNGFTPGIQSPLNAQGGLTFQMPTTAATPGSLSTAPAVALPEGAAGPFANILAGGGGGGPLGSVLGPGAATTTATAPAATTAIAPATGAAGGAGAGGTGAALAAGGPYAAAAAALGAGIYYGSRDRDDNFYARHVRRGTDFVRDTGRKAEDIAEKGADAVTGLGEKTGQALSKITTDPLKKLFELF